MSTSNATFSALPLPQQLLLMEEESTFLMQRWEVEATVSLYYMKSHFFCEVYRHPDTLESLFLHTFTSLEHLQNYTDHITLDDLNT